MDSYAELVKKTKAILESRGFDLSAKEEYGTISEWCVSVRAYNVLQSHRLVTKQSLLGFYRENGNKIPHYLKNCGKKTINEIEELCKYLIKTQEQNNSAEPEIDTDSQTSSFRSSFHIEKNDMIISEFSKLISLDINDRLFLSTYKENYGHFPILWLLSRYIESDDDVLCFAYVYGIVKSKGVKSTLELAEARKVTRSRIRMRVSRGQKKLFEDNSVINIAILHSDKDYLLDCFGTRDFIASSDINQDITDINKQEGTSFSNAFLLKYLSVLFKGYNTIGGFEGNKANPEIIVLSNELSSIFNFESFFARFDAFVEEATIDTMLNLREYIEDSPCWLHFSMSDVTRILCVAKSYALSRHGLYEEDESDTIHIIPKKYDITAIVYAIVCDADVPLTIGDIIQIASEQYPLHHFSEDEIRIALRDDLRIQHIRRGTLPTQYLLASRNAPTSIRDAVVKVLLSSDKPVLLDDIVNYVLAFFPTSSKNSIRTSLLSDGQNRFVQYEGGKYGLSSKAYPSEFVQVTDSIRMPFAERLILLKKFLDEKCRFPSIDSSDEQEVDFAKWIERNQDRKEVKDLIDKYAFDIWVSQCLRCECYIVKHNGRIPPKEIEPNLYKWLFEATMDLKEDRLTQEQRKMFLHLKMQIRQ